MENEQKPKPSLNLGSPVQPISSSDPLTNEHIEKKAAEAAVKESQEKDSVVIPRDVLQTLMDTARNKPADSGDLASTLKQLAKLMTDNKVQNEPGTFGTRTPVAESDIDPDDILNDEAIFFSWCYSTTIWDDYRNKIPIKTPYGSPIPFYHLFRRTYKDSGGMTREQRTVSVCVARVRSKKEAEFIRKHSLFGIKFFEDIRKVNNVDVEFQQKLADTARRVAGMSQSEVINWAKSYAARGANINLHSPDLQQMKGQLIHAISKEEFEKDKHRYDSVVNDTQSALKTVEPHLRMAPGSPAPQSGSYV